MLSEPLEDASPVRLFDPLYLHLFNRSASHNLIQSTHYSDGSAILELLNHWTCLCDQPQKVEIIGFLHGQPICLFILLMLHHLHDARPCECKFRLL